MEARTRSNALCRSVVTSTRCSPLSYTSLTLAPKIEGHALEPIEKRVTAPHDARPAAQLFANLALGGEAEPGDGEVEAGLPEAVTHGGACGEQDGLAVAWVGG